MSLLSENIAKVKRLPLREVKLPAPEIKEPGKAITREEATYSKLLAKYPLLEELVETLDLVSLQTGERMRRVEVRDEPVDSSRLIALASKILQTENSYSLEEVISRLQEATKVNQERAERGFKLMLQVGAIKPTVGERYYLPGSTPF